MIASRAAAGSSPRSSSCSDWLGRELGAEGKKLNPQMKQAPISSRRLKRALRLLLSQGEEARSLA
jgi:hypothetical protein